MTTVSTKHHPRSLVPPSEIGSTTLREVPAPARVLKAVHETDGFVLGFREPEDGRYRSLVRSNFIRPEQQPIKPGDDPERHLSGPLSLNKERRLRANEMNSKHFRFDSEGSDIPIVSELQGAQQSAVNLLTAQQNRSHGVVARSAAPYTSPTPPPKSSPLEERHAHVARMQASNVFAGPLLEEEINYTQGQSEINSTHRVSYREPDSNSVAAQRAGAAELRKLQTTTNWAPPPRTTAKDWKSIKEYTITGAPGQAAQLSKQNLSTWVNIGSSAVSTKETLRSHKQVDFVPHKATPTPPPAFTAHEDHLVLGYLPRDVDSTSRVSYTPVVFVPPGSEPALRPEAVSSIPRRR